MTVSYLSRTYPWWSLYIWTLYLLIPHGNDGTTYFKGIPLVEFTYLPCIFSYHMRISITSFEDVSLMEFIYLVFIIIDRFYIALVSAFEQTHCARM